ncbi:3-keto-disaccharide hydrolase [Sunxiuqinia rutila]|uniref:3-keto-disaccharide hydrolase n=1 Tax=Sunxiuqinia rutila TaxID=1397841 RepID=UPI003D36A138
MRRQNWMTILMMAVFTLGVASVSAQKANKLTKKEKKEGWVLLFNGKNFDGWRQCNGQAMPANWTLEDDAMKVLIGEGKQPGHGAGGDILFGEKKFKNFELSIDWKASDQGNSGIFYYVREVPGKPIYFAAPEVQILDNDNASDNKIASHLAGSLYDMIPADPKTVNPAGSWNTVVIKVKDGKVTHTMNGTEVVAYSLWTPEWDELVQNSKFKNFPGFTEGIAREGYIGLQDHGYPIWFRNIKIREL